MVYSTNSIIESEKKHNPLTLELLYPLVHQNGNKIYN